MSGLEQLWAGWRHEYVIDSTDQERSGGDQCVFCRIAMSGPPSADNGVIYRGENCYVVLNAYPYTCGHLLILPIRHVEELSNLTEHEGAELWETTRAAASAIEQAYAPQGINLGANLGRAAGAGIPRHLHLHAVPRWAGDTNFMTSVAGVRVLPESLGSTWGRLYEAWPNRS